MTPLFTRAEARAFDGDAEVRLSLSGAVLMENAGRGATDALALRFPDALERVVCVGGPGQNGGDAWVVARHLAVRGHAPRAVLVGDRARVRGDAAANLACLEALGLLALASADDLDGVAAELEGATLIVDGLFGTGLTREVAGVYAAVIAQMNAASAPVAALDLPSGVDADTGQVLGTAPRAELTITFAGPKRGLHQYPGVAHAGQVVVVDIGAPPARDAAARLFGAADLRPLVPLRPGDSHKGTAGHVVVVAGSAGKTGAALLSGHGAMRGGAGLVTLAAGPEARAALDAKVVELMTAELPEHDALGAALALLDGKRAAVVGPGLGLDLHARSLALGLADGAPLPLVLDADALTALADDGGLERLVRAAGPRVLTPHPGEASRLLGVSSQAIQADRFGAAEALARRSGQVVVLKGARTLVAAAEGLFVCAAGTPALGVAGTGDVLAGCLAAMLATRPPLVAAQAAVLVHALAGERAARGDRGLLASEVADALPEVIGGA